MVKILIHRIYFWIILQKRENWQKLIFNVIEDNVELKIFKGEINGSFKMDLGRSVIGLILPLSYFCNKFKLIKCLQITIN